MWIGYLCAVIVCVVFGIALYGSMKEIKLLKDDRANMQIVAKRLEKELDKYKDVEIKVALTLAEKRIILNALEASQYKARVTDPKTKRFIRIIYNTLRTKIQDSIKE